MGLGGFIEHARKTVEANRALVGKRISAREKIQDMARSKKGSLEDVDKDAVEMRLAHQRSRRSKGRIITKLGSLLVIFAVVIILGYVVMQLVNFHG